MAVNDPAEILSAVVTASVTHLGRIHLSSGADLVQWEPTTSKVVKQGMFHHGKQTNCGQRKSNNNSLERLAVQEVKRPKKEIAKKRPGKGMKTAPAMNFFFFFYFYIKMPPIVMFT